MRADGTISSIDILRFVKSRYALDITHPEAVDVVRGLGGGVACAEVISSAVIKRNQQLKSQIKKKRALWGGSEQEGDSESEIKSEISDLPIVEYLDLVQIMSIIMIPTFVKVGRRWKQSNQDSYIEVEDEDPAFTPIPGGLLADYILGLVYDREDKSLIPPENLISDVLRGFWRDMGHKGLRLDDLPLQKSLAEDESSQDGTASESFDIDRKLKTSASQRMGLSMMFEAESARCFTHDVESKQHVCCKESFPTGEAHNTASAQEEATNAVLSETDTAVSQEHSKVDEGDDIVVSQQKAVMSSQEIDPARGTGNATVFTEESKTSNGTVEIAALQQEGSAGFEETLVSRSANGATDAAFVAHQQAVVDHEETSSPCGIVIEPAVPQQKSTIAQEANTVMSHGSDEAGCNLDEKEEMHKQKNGPSEIAMKYDSEGKADTSMGRAMESSRKYEQCHNEEKGTSTKREPVGIDMTATFDEKRLVATHNDAGARAGNDELKLPLECVVENPSFTSRKQEIPTESEPLSTEERKAGSLESFHRESQAPSSTSSNGPDISLPGMANLPPKLTPGLVKALFLANGEYERAKDTELIHRMIEAAHSSSGRFDEEALINAITSDLGAWGLEFEDRNTTYIYDCFGAEEAYSFQQSGLSQQYQEPIDSVKKDGPGNNEIAKRTTLEPIDSVIDSFASTFTVVIIWIFYICFSATHIGLSRKAFSLKIDCRGLSSFWCTLISTIYTWYAFTHSIIIRLCRLYTNLYLRIA